MAWGRGPAQGLDDLCVRLRNNDASLTSLTVLKHRKFDYVEVCKLCDALSSNTVLTELYASNHPVGPEAAAALSGVLASNTCIMSLCVGDATFGDAGVAALAPGLKASKSLRSLDLERKGVTPSGATTLANVMADNDTLTSLSLARNHLTDAGAAALSSRPWRVLQHLDLSECGLGCSAATALAGPDGTPGPALLVSLNLSGNSLGAAAGTKLVHLMGKCSTLRELQLRSCALGDDGVAGMAPGLASHACLRSLDLSDNGAGAGAATALAAALSTNTCLSSLELGGGAGGMCADSVAQLAASLAANQHSALIRVNLAGARLGGDAGAAAVEALSRCSLRHVCLLGTRLGSTGAAQLLACLRNGGFAVAEEMSVSGCELEWGGDLEPLLTALLAGVAPQLRVLECGANPACQADALADIVLKLRAERPGLQVHWNAADQGNAAEGAAFDRAAGSASHLRQDRTGMPQM